MSDQAETLRRLMEQREGELPHVFVVSSGRTGIGQTWLVANLGALLARDGAKVLMVDAEMGAESHPQGTPAEVEPRLWLASGAVMKSPRFREAAQSFDIVLIDSGVEQPSCIDSLHSPCFRNVILLTPDPSSIADAYRLVKDLTNRTSLRRFGVIVNQVTDANIAQEAFKMLGTVASQFLDVQLDYLGYCVRDENFKRTVVKPKILVNCDDGAVSRASLEILAKKLRESCTFSLGPSTGPSIRVR